MNLEQLKSELKEKEKGCGDFHCKKCSLKCGDTIDGKLYLCQTCQAEISALKKGISACEEILNSQQKCKGKGEKEKRECSTIQQVTNPFDFTSSPADNQTIIKQAEKQRDKEELDILVNNIEQVKSFIKLNIPNVEDKYIIVNCFSGMIKRQMDLEQQLTTKEEGKNDT